MSVYRAGQAPEEMVTLTHANGRTEEVPISKYLHKVGMMALMALHSSGKPDALVCMQAVYMFTLADKPLPDEIKKWFLEGLDEHGKHEGKKTLDEIYGYKKEEKKPNAYTKAKAETEYLALVAERLVFVANIRPIEAARLSVWREVSDASPSSVTRKMRERRNSGKTDSGIIWNDARVHNEHIEFLETFTEAAKRLMVGGVIKELDKLKAVIDKISILTPENYHQTLLSKKAD